MSYCCLCFKSSLTADNQLHLIWKPTSIHCVFVALFCYTVEFLNIPKIIHGFHLHIRINIKHNHTKQNLKIYVVLFKMFHLTFTEREWIGYV